MTNVLTLGKIIPMNTKTTTHHVPAAQFPSFRRSIYRQGGVITLSSPIGGDRYAVTVRVK